MRVRSGSSAAATAARTKVLADFTNRSEGPEANGVQISDSSAHRPKKITIRPVGENIAARNWRGPRDPGSSSQATSVSATPTGAST